MQVQQQSLRKTDYFFINFNKNLHLTKHFQKESISEKCTNVHANIANENFANITKSQKRDSEHLLVTRTFPQFVICDTKDICYHKLLIFFFFGKCNPGVN